MCHDFDIKHMEITSMIALRARMAQWWKCLPPTNVTQVWLWPSAMSGSSLLFVLALPKGFLGFSSFPPSTKTKISKFQFNLGRGAAWKPALADAAFSLNVVIYPLILLTCSTTYSSSSPVDTVLIRPGTAADAAFFFSACSFSFSNRIKAHVKHKLLQ